jgi:hypothetical protein
MGVNEPPNKNLYGDSEENLGKKPIAYKMTDI